MSPLKTLQSPSGTLASFLVALSLMTYRRTAVMTPDMETSPALASVATVNSCHHLPLMNDKPTVLKADLDLRDQLCFLSTHSFQ